MVYNFVAGGAGINALSRVSNTRVVVVDMGVAADLSGLASTGKIIDKKIGIGTRSFLSGPAMSREDAERSVEAGIEVAMSLRSEVDLFATGDMGIGNTTPSSAITAVATGLPAAEVTGRGTGISEEQLKHKVAAIEKGLAANKLDRSDGIDVLAKVGGFEIGGIAGLILGAGAQGKPVLVDGFVSTAGALIAQMIEPKSALYMIAAHRSVERGHRAALKRLGKEPLLDLDLRLGEGTGAALAMCLVEAAVRILTEVATFAEAGVSGKG
jgi:nicotinate-nucleotide--dimethylbenzimidazole phosphoribosyltransferase